MTLLAINAVERPPYDDVYVTFGPGGERTERREPAPVVASFDLTVETAGRARTYGAEVRQAPGGEPQVDWDDALGDLMHASGMPPRAYYLLGLAIVQAHWGEPVRLPQALGVPLPDGAV